MRLCASQKLNQSRSYQHKTTYVRSSKPLQRRVISSAATTLQPVDNGSSSGATPAGSPDGLPKQSNGYKEAIMMQAFAWDSCFQKNWYGTVFSKVQDLKAIGVSHLWLPPPSQSVSPQGYMPGQLYNLTSKYGDREQLLKLNQALNQAGIQPIADIVINHRCADEMDGGVYNRFRDDVDHKGRRIDWGKWAITCNDPTFQGSGNPDTGDDYGPAPDLDHANPELRAALKDWLSWLQRDIGFQGWRFDFTRGYAPRFITEYVDASTGADSLNVGEFWVDLQWNGANLEYNQDAARQRLCDWINANGERSCAFDFPTKGLLQEAAKRCQYDRLRDARGKAPGLLGWWPAKAVTFVENHDTGSIQQHWPFPSDHVGLGYAYILTHPGIPCLFWDHVFSWGEGLRREISSLTALRRRLGVVADSPLRVLTADKDLYVARVDGRSGSVVLKLGPRYDMGSLLPRREDGWTMALSGRDWAVWERPAMTAGAAGGAAGISNRNGANNGAGPQH
ncbi:hypothetical protein Vretimale_12784 [Volvox reticuliferus]|uniref:Alpha-amylase n=1 Tax=Volvox reticuliferus TaxID=1737510 RepID=A0A8J4LTD9_9CHLO|nr:hypothetical protein Vretifemale_10235 [Volvox reticuliferus]GIM08823.1 hypothetical protein Vretimale_12784 [Volvox reticuliferus]